MGKLLFLLSFIWTIHTINLVLRMLWGGWSLVIVDNHSWKHFKNFFHGKLFFSSWKAYVEFVVLLFSILFTVLKNKDKNTSYENQFTFTQQQSKTNAPSLIWNIIIVLIPTQIRHEILFLLTGKKFQSSLSKMEQVYYAKLKQNNIRCFTIKRTRNQTLLTKTKQRIFTDMKCFLVMEDIYGLIKPPYHTKLSHIYIYFKESKRSTYKEGNTYRDHAHYEEISSNLTHYSCESF